MECCHPLSALDGLQLAHYTRMLQAAGRHPGAHMRWGAVLAPTACDRGRPGTWVFTWHDLTEPLGFTFSAQPRQSRRSLLERYDHEHRFRCRSPRPPAGPPQCGPADREPVGQPECRTAPYQQTCADQMGPLTSPPRH